MTAHVVRAHREEERGFDATGFQNSTELGNTLSCSTKRVDIDSQTKSIGHATHRLLAVSV